MRLFLAIDLPKKTKKDLELQTREIKKDYPQFSWVSPDNYHITAHFFGEVKDKKRIKERIKNILYDQGDFYLYSLKAGLFINTKITIYLEFRREKKIEKLAAKISSSFGETFVRRKFLPHLTLARTRIPSKQQYFVIKKRLEKLKIDLQFHVKEVYLFQSILGGKKPVYKKLARFPLIKE